MSISAKLTVKTLDITLLFGELSKNEKKKKKKKEQG